MTALLALIAVVVPLTPGEARQVARDAAPEITGIRVVSTSARACDIRGRFARCAVRARGRRATCRYVAHIREDRPSRYTISATGLNCWHR